ncbi:methyltransferase-like protein 24 [Lingula anatina]|uniref:Methyltransferase-like protein 24 n=1 Tax=Lingula anatina TaxID=7574 RepID=A0A1S3HDP3_LINAN|nr:methyltransferase-like protein 24 [Lingula anatina]|eukprot:XP_013384145.1 methyltransferase-like protein 24 [Lingula anatina]
MVKFRWTRQIEKNFTNCLTWIAMCAGISLLFVMIGSWSGLLCAQEYKPSKRTEGSHVFRIKDPVIQTDRLEGKDAPEFITNMNMSMEAYDKLERDFFRYLNNIQFDCRNRIRAGGDPEGGWEVCLDPPYDMKKDACLVYSFGIARDWTFDDYMGDVFHCEVHSFDPSIGEKDHKRSKYVNFHNLGIFGRNSVITKKKVPWTVKTLGSIMNKLGHREKTLDYLKIDVESHEWMSLQTAIAEGALRHVKQLGMEFHSAEHNLLQPMRISIWRGLYRLGFRIYFTSWNHNCRRTSIATGRTIFTCQEVHFVNINFMQE